MTNYFAGMNTLRKAKDIAEKVPMTAAQEKALSAKLKKDGRVNVYPNKFDRNQPLRVTVRKGKEFTNHGLFTDADVASAVGTLCGMAIYGDQAIAGEFKQDYVEAHKEFQAWIADERNADILEALAA